MTSLLEEVRQARQLPTPHRAKAIRQALGISQSRLARELGVHRLTVFRWENGLRRPRGSHLSRYLEILGGLQAELGQ